MHTAKPQITHDVHPGDLPRGGDDDDRVGPAETALLRDEQLFQRHVPYWTYERQHFKNLEQLSGTTVGREMEPLRREADRPILVQEVLRQRGADRHGVLFNRFDAAAGHDALVHVEDEPDVR